MRIGNDIILPNPIHDEELEKSLVLVDKKNWTRNINHTLPSHVIDWLWDECFNCWDLYRHRYADIRPNMIGAYLYQHVIHFDAESDAVKFEERFNESADI